MPPKPPDDGPDANVDDLIKNKNPPLLTHLIKRFHVYAVHILAGVGLAAVADRAINPRAKDHGPPLELVEVLPKSDLERLFDAFSERKQDGVTVDSRGLMTLSMDVSGKNLPAEIQELVDMLRAQIPGEKDVLPENLRLRGNRGGNFFNVELTYRTKDGRGGGIGQGLEPATEARIRRQVMEDLLKGKFRPGL